MAGPAGSTDPMYDKPYVDLDEWRDQPVRHRYVHGGFHDTELRFSIYLPPPERYEGRFFQPLMAVSGVDFAARIDVPPGTGVVVAADWDFEGAGDFPVSAPFEFVSPDGSSVAVKASYAFSAPGTYFPALRATSQRRGDAKTRFGRISNLGRVRVVVR